MDISSNVKDPWFNAIAPVNKTKLDLWFSKATYVITDK